MFTLAAPTTRPEFENSVICCGRSEPPGFLVRSYQPKLSAPSNSFAKPEIAV
jgi:hypothetical protein